MTDVYRCEARPVAVVNSSPLLYRLQAVSKVFSRDANDGSYPQFAIFQAACRQRPEGGGQVSRASMP